MKIRKGFTLIELLVVIAIITILFGIVRPTLSASASRAREYECESNLKQIGMAVHAYVEDYGAFPKKLTDIDGILQDKDLLVCPGTSERYYYHAPDKDADRSETIVSCIDPHKAGSACPHRYGEGYLVLTAGGKVQKVVKSRTED